MKNIFASELTSNSSSALDTLGDIRYEAGKFYMYVQAEDLAITDGDVVEFSNVAGSEVTIDRAGGSSIGRLPAGVAIGAITDAYYGWIQIFGVHTNVKTDGGVSAGEYLVPHATANGQADSNVAGTDDAEVFGFALEADDAETPSRVTTFVRCM